MYKSQATSAPSHTVSFTGGVNEPSIECRNAIVTSLGIQLSGKKEYHNICTYLPA